MRKQICIIHGADAFESDADARQYLQDMTIDYERLLPSPSWKRWLSEQLREYDVLLPQMPSSFNAKYEEWEIYFSKIVPFLRPDATLIGHSMGGVFLAKHFSEHPADHRFVKLILIAAPYDDETSESLGGFKVSDVSKLAEVFDKVHILHSTDDPVVRFSETESYKRDLPNATVHTFEDMQHFNMPAFPELLSIIGK